MDQKDTVSSLDFYRHPMKRYSWLGGEKVYAVLFPSSDVWDWYHQGIREPGRPGYYEEVKTLLEANQQP